MMLYTNANILDMIFPVFCFPAEPGMGAICRLFPVFLFLPHLDKKKFLVLLSGTGLPGQYFFGNPDGSVGRVSFYPPMDGSRQFV
jgi:hypothetical protein